MAEYIDRELAMDAIRRLRIGLRHDGLYKEDLIIIDIMTRLESVPSADVQPVVRCKECRYRDPEDHKCDCGKLERAGCVFRVSDDYFCAYGEGRK